MISKKTLPKPKKLKTSSLREHTAFTSKELKRKKNVIESLNECIKSNDLNSFREVLAAHMITKHKSRIAKKAGIDQTTLYKLLDLKTDFDLEPAKAFNLIEALSK